MNISYHVQMCMRDEDKPAEKAWAGLSTDIYVKLKSHMEILTGLCSGKMPYLMSCSLSVHAFWEGQQQV